MSDPNISEIEIPPHFTNIQHALQLGRQFLSRQDTPNRQIILITDGLPTAHFEGSKLYLLYPPDPRTEKATLREGAALPPRGDHDQHLSACKAGRNRPKTCSSPTAWPNRPPAECSSPPAETSIATWSGITSTTGERSWRKAPVSRNALAKRFGVNYRRPASVEA